MKRFSGIWENEKGDRIIILEKTSKTGICDFISGETKEPVKRPYLNNSLTINMKVELDYYESGIEIDLGNEMKMCLDDPDYLQKAMTLTCGISRPYSREYEYLSQYVNLFGLKSFQRIE